jgi:hypothetical protein
MDNDHNCDSYINMPSLQPIDSINRLGFVAET